MTNPPPPYHPTGVFKQEPSEAYKQLAAILRRFHRDSCYPEADEVEVDQAIRAICKVLDEAPPPIMIFTS